MVLWVTKGAIDFVEINIMRKSKLSVMLHTYNSFVINSSHLINKITSPLNFPLKHFFPFCVAVTFEGDLTSETDSITMRLSLSAPLWYNCLYC